MDSDIALNDLRGEERVFEGSDDNLRRRFPRPSDASRREFTLPQADRGKDAWLFLAGCFMVEALIWGFPFSFGVFQEYYSTHEPFSLKPSGIAIIGTSSTGIMYLSCPILFAVFKRWPHIRRSSTMTGLAINTAAIVAASFATQVSHLILTQGVLYAIGGVMIYCPTIVFLDEWFVRRKGLAFGMMWAGTGVSGIVLPFIMSALLARFSFQTTLRAYAVALVLLALPLLYFVRPRLPLAQTSLQRRLDLGFLRTSIFWVPQTCNIIQGLGYFIPNIYLPTYAKSQGMTGTEGTLMLALVNMGVVFGAIWAGALTDRMHVSSVMAICSMGAALAVFVFWAGGYSATYSGIVSKVREVDGAADMGMVIGFLALGRGIGAVASGPLSEALLHLQSWKGEAKFGYGTGYGGLIVFTGITAAAGGSSWIARRIGWT
ncbi:MAG: hypothetical protein L6R40_003033 [Gallowayella cf. fulva]|nr:MAG: hypothetical protein L6R40_003033 [Xanthomendoza cf. fulva]